MPAIDEATLKKQIREQDFGRVYLLYGEEPYLVSEYGRRIARKAAGGAMEDFNLQTFDGRAPVEEIAEAAEALPLMAERKCVVVVDYDADSANAAETAKMKQLLADPPASCVLVFRQQSVAVNAKKSAKWRSFIKQVEECGCSVHFPRRDSAALAKFLTDTASGMGYTFSGDCGRYLIRQCGTDLTNLLGELEKICAFSGPETSITRETIDAVAVKTTETAVYKLANALVSGNYGEAYALLDTLFYQREEPVFILGSLASAYIDLYRAKAALESGTPVTEIAKAFDYRGLEFRLRNAARDCRRLTMEQLRRSLDWISQTDLALKSTRTDPRVLLEELLARLLMTAAGGRAEG